MGSAALSPARKVASAMPKDRVSVSIPMRALGRTGERVSAIGLGGFHLGKPDLPDAESVRIIRSAIDAGVNFLDNSWDYNDGRSEIRMGRALRDGYRERAFLMTKIDGQTRAAAARQIEESAGGRDDDIDPGAESVLLRGHPDAAVYGVTADPGPLGQATEGDLDLGRELAGRREDEGAGSPRRLLQQSLQDRQEERGRLPGPGLRGADDVATGEDRGDRLFLDRGGSLVAEGVDRPEEDRFEAELVEGMLRVGCMHRPSYELIGLRVPIRRTRILRCAFPGLGRR